MNIRLIMSVAISTVMFATHARSAETLGVWMKMTDKEMLSMLRKDVEHDEKCLENRKKIYDEIKQLNTKSSALDEKTTQKELEVNLEYQKLTTEMIKAKKQMIAILGALVKSGTLRQTSQLSPSQEKQVYVLNTFPSKHSKNEADIEICRSKVKSLKVDLAKHREKHGDDKQSVLYNQQIWVLLAEWKQLLTGITRINQEMTNVILHGTDAPKTDGQSRKWRAIKKVLLVVLLITVVLVGFGVTVLLYK